MDDSPSLSISVNTQVGTLQVDSIGTGPAAVLWHSLFVDSRSWHRVVQDLASDRRLILITGPGHGHSGDPGHRYSMEDCARAAATVMDELGIEEPADWVGNAWGGHVGLTLAAREPHRVRTLLTVGTPVHGYSRKDRLETRLLLVLYRVFGPVRFLRDSVTAALLSQRTRSEDPQAVELVQQSFADADRAGMLNAVVSISLHRVDLSGLLPSIQAPTLFVTGSEHGDWPPALAQNASRSLPRGSSAVLDDSAYLGPLERPEEFVRLVRDFWRSPAHAAPPSSVDS